MEKVLYFLIVNVSLFYLFWLYVLEDKESKGIDKATQTDQSSSDLDQLKRERDLLAERIQRIEEENARLVEEVNQQRQRQLENEIAQTWSLE